VVARARRFGPVIRGHGSDGLLTPVTCI